MVQGMDRGLTFWAAAIWLPVQFQAYAVSIQQHDDVRQVAANHSTWTECSCDTVGDRVRTIQLFLWRNMTKSWTMKNHWKIRQQLLCTPRFPLMFCMSVSNEKMPTNYILIPSRLVKPKDANCLVKQHKTTIRKIEEQHVWCWNHWVQLWEHLVRLEEGTKAPQRKDARGLPVQQRCLRRAKDLQGPESGGAPSQVPNWKQCTKFIEYVDTDQENSVWMCLVNTPWI